MGVVKTVKHYVTKSLQKLSDVFIPLTSTDSSLFRLLGTDYRFGTQSKDFLLKAYGMNPYAFMVIDRISQRLVQIDKRLLDRIGQETEDVEFEELLKQPNTKENGDSFLYRAAATYLAAGECFVVRVQALGEPDQYVVPINYNVTINEDTKGNVLSYWITMFGESETFLPNEVLHIHKPDITIDTNHGFSTLRANRKVWESNNEVWASEASLHKNKGIAGVLYSDGNRPMTDTEQKQLQEKYDQDFTGANSFGRVKISTAKLGYVQMGMNPNDLKSIETRLEHLRTICASYNVDSKLFGDSAASTYNNMAEAKRAFIIDAVIPLSEVLLPAIIGFMARSVFQNYSMQLIEESILELQIVMEQKSARVGREVIQGILTPEQAREMLYPELVEELEDGEGAQSDQSGGSQEDVLEEDSAAEAANAQAQAAFRGSVGGVQGILQIQQSVEAGTTARESAIVILMQIYGFDGDTANEILG